MRSDFELSLPACLEMWPGMSTERRADEFRRDIRDHCRLLAEVAEDSEESLVLLGEPTGVPERDAERTKQRATLVDEIHDCGQKCDAWADVLDKSDAELVAFIESLHAKRSAA